MKIAVKEFKKLLKEKLNVITISNVIDIEKYLEDAQYADDKSAIGEFEDRYYNSEVLLNIKLKGTDSDNLDRVKYSLSSLSEYLNESEFEFSLDENIKSESFYSDITIKPKLSEVDYNIDLRFRINVKEDGFFSIVSANGLAEISYIYYLSSKETYKQTLYTPAEYDMYFVNISKKVSFEENKEILEDDINFFSE